MNLRLHNLIEPSALIQHFLQHPPEGFSTAEVGGVPVFSTPFNLLTTMEPSDRLRIERLPLYHWWRRALTPHTLFVGTTVSEYGLLPQCSSADEFLAGLLKAADTHAFVIVKDLPVDPLLVGTGAYDYVQAFIASAQAAGFLILQGQALAYVPIDFASVDEFLARMPKSRRKDIKRKTKNTRQLEIERIYTSDARFSDDRLIAEYYGLYRQVYDQSEIHFDLLSPEFFRAVLQDKACDGIVFTYRVETKLIGYNLCFVHNDMLIDKYVGFSYPASREHNLYFVSWLVNLEFALEKGLRYYVAGWTDPEIKRHLGASFSFTRHAVFVRNGLLRRILSPFRRLFEADSSWYETARP